MNRIHASPALALLTFALGACASESHDMLVQNLDPATKPGADFFQTEKPLSMGTSWRQPPAAIAGRGRVSNTTIRASATNPIAT